MLDSDAPPPHAISHRRGSYPLLPTEDRDVRPSNDRRFSVNTWPFSRLDESEGSRGVSDKASLSSVFSFVLDEEELCCADRVWSEFKAELEARNLKTDLGVKGMLGKFVADKRPRPPAAEPPPSRRDAADKNRNLLRRLSSSMSSMSLISVDDFRSTGDTVDPSAVPLAGRRASVSSTGSHAAKIAEMGLRRSCPSDLGLMSLECELAGGESASLNSDGNAAEMVMSRSCPDIGLLVEWGETGEDESSAEDGPSGCCAVAGGKDAEADAKGDDIPPEVWEALAGEPIGRDRHAEDVTTACGIGPIQAASFPLADDRSDAAISRCQEYDAAPQERSVASTSSLPSREVARPRPPCSTLHSCLKLPSCEAPPPPSSPSANEDCDNNPSSDQSMGHLLSLLLSVDGDPREEDRETGEARENQRTATAPRRTRVRHGQSARRCDVRARTADAIRGRRQEREATTVKCNKQGATGQISLSGTQRQPSSSEQCQACRRVGDASLMADSASSCASNEPKDTANEQQATHERISDLPLTRDSLSFMPHKMGNTNLTQGPEQAKSCGTDSRSNYKTNITQGSLSDLSTNSKSIFFMRCKMKIESLMQERDKRKNGGIDSTPNDQSNHDKVSNQGLTKSPDDLFHCYLENETRTRIEVSERESINDLASPAIPALCLLDLDPSTKNDYQVGQLLVEWGDTSTVATDEEGIEDLDEDKNEKDKVVDTNFIKENPNGEGQGERGATPVGHAGLESCCITIDCDKTGRRMSDLTFAELKDMGAPP